MQPSVTTPSERRFARNAGLNLLGQGLPLLAALPAIPLLIRGAGLERFGILTIAWAVIGYLGLFDFGIGRALTYAVAERVGHGREDSAVHVVRSGLGLAFVISGSAGILLFLGAPWAASLLRPSAQLSREAAAAIRVIAVAIPVVVLAALFRGVLEGLHRFGVVNVVRVMMGVATFAAPLLVLPWSSHLALLIGALLLARLLGLFGYAWAVWRALPRSALSDPGGPAAPGAGALLRFGGWTTVSNLVSPLMVQFDRVVIGAVLGAAAVALYTTPFEIVNRLLVIPGSIVAAFFPMVAQDAGAGGDGRPSLFRASVHGILLLLLPPALILFAFADAGLDRWVGSAFAVEGVDVARWLLVGTTANAIAHVPFIFLQGIGRPDVTAKLHLIELPLYVAALLWTLPRFGISGAAAVWSGRATLDLVFLLVALGRVAPRLRIETARAALALGLGLAVLLLPLAFPSLIERLVLVTLVAVGCAAVGWRQFRGRDQLSV